MEVILSHPFGRVKDLPQPSLTWEGAFRRPCQNDMRPPLAPRNHPFRPNANLTQLYIYKHVTPVQKPFGTLFA
jgi:hypothetical protein